MFELGGVPSEPRFRNLTEAQWGVLISHHVNRKSHMFEEVLQGLEYIALLVTINPKGVMKAINARRKAMKLSEGIEVNEDKAIMVNSQGETEDGRFVNTSFFADIEKYAGEEVLGKLGEETTDYKIKAPPPIEKPLEDMDEDERFIAETKRAFAEREKELEEEEKFRRENPELFENDSVIF